MLFLTENMHSCKIKILPNSASILIFNDLRGEYPRPREKFITTSGVHMVPPQVSLNDIETSVHRQNKSELIHETLLSFKHSNRTD